MTGPASEVVACATFEDFVEKVRRHRYATSRLFRGQQNVGWKLQSLWDRWLSGRFLEPGPHNYDALFGGPEGRREFARGQLDSFRKLVSGMPSVPPDLLTDDLRLWALGRHHGLVTPLLDWSESPYVAAFFAFFDRLAATHSGFKYGPGFCGPILITPEPVAVWEIYYDDTVIRKQEFEVYVARDASAIRQKAQAGVLTYLMHPSILSVEDYLLSLKLGHFLRRYEISGSAAAAAMGSLRQMNITYSTLFPDLDGAAVEANLAGLMNSLNLGE
jgi:FRG domain